MTLKSSTILRLRQLAIHPLSAAPSIETTPSAWSRLCRSPAPFLFIIGTPFPRARQLNQVLAKQPFFPQTAGLCWLAGCFGEKSGKRPANAFVDANRRPQGTTVIPNQEAASFEDNSVDAPKESALVIAARKSAATSPGLPKPALLARRRSFVCFVLAGAFKQRGSG